MDSDLAIGLRHLAAGRFKRASQRFEEADALLPGLPDVKRAIAEAEDKNKTRRPVHFHGRGLRSA